MKTESMSDVNRTPKLLTASAELVIVTHYRAPAGVWIPLRLLENLDSLIESLKAVKAKVLA